MAPRNDSSLADTLGFTRPLSADERHSQRTALLSYVNLKLAAHGQPIAKSAEGLEIVSLALIVWGSSGIFMPVEMALNRAWGGHPHRHFLRSRMLAVLMTVAGGLLALCSVALTLAAREWARELPALARHGAKAVGVFMSYVLFFLIYRFVPAVSVRTAMAVRAALWGGTSWEAAKYLFLIQLARMNLETFYGPLAFSVSLVLWAYVSSLALVFGALMVPADPPP